MNKDLKKAKGKDMRLLHDKIAQEIQNSKIGTSETLLGILFSMSVERMKRIIKY